MLPRSEKSQDVFSMLKARFPDLDLSVFNPHFSFSRNLENIVSQLGTPASFDTPLQISTMKEAMDKQELKIQTSLVNQTDVLGDITNRAVQRGHQKKETVNHDEYASWNADPKDSFIDLWEWGNEESRGWFHE